MICEAPDHENIFRAVLTADWHAEENRISSSLFAGANNSVSLESIKDKKKTIVIFKKELHTPPKKRLLAIGKISVGKLKEIGKEGKPQISIRVIPEPTPTNPAHATIPEKISPGKSKKIIAQLEITMVKFAWWERILNWVKAKSRAKSLHRPRKI